MGGSYAKERRKVQCVRDIALRANKLTGGCVKEDVLVEVKEILGCRVESLDGEIGKVSDIYFHDREWVVQYLVVSMGRGSTTRTVVIEPAHITGFNEERRSYGLDLTRAEVDEAPSTNEVVPVSRQYEMRFRGTSGRTESPHLRSYKGVQGYNCVTDNEAVGRLGDLIMDQETWEIRYLQLQLPVENTTVRFNIAANAVERFSWATERVCLRYFEPVQLHEGSMLQFNNQDAA
jgi:sporulation protein YlmC with PRC-barrel domain